MLSRAGRHGATSAAWKLALGSIALGGAAYYYNYQRGSRGVLSSERYIPLKLQAVQDVNHDTSLLRLELERKPKHFPVPSSVYIKDDTIQIMRPYTPINDPSEDGHVDLLVKRYENGSISKMLCRLEKGDDVYVRGPMVEFEYPSGAYRHIGMVGR